MILPLSMTSITYPKYQYHPDDTSEMRDTNDPTGTTTDDFLLQATKSDTGTRWSATRIRVVRNYLR
jgi:hypothetical protein